MGERLVVLAVDVHDAVPEEIRALVTGRIAFSAGLAAVGQGDAPRVPPEFVAKVSRELHPDRWQATNIPHVFSVRDGAGRAFLAWQVEGGTVLGLAGEINLAVWAEASVSVLVPERPNLTIQ